MTMPATPLGERSLVERVVQIVGQEIVDGRFPPGAMLPYETEWCDRLGVSRSVVREARRVLVSKKIIEIKARAGGRVRPMEGWNLLDPDVLNWRARGPDRPAFATELFELRRVLEPAAAALAARRITPSELANLRAAFEEMQAAGEDTATFLEPDIRFHRIVAGSVGNSLFRAVGDLVAVALELALRISLKASRGQRQSLPLHERVLGALAARDPDQASAAMRELVDEAERDVREVLSQPRPSIATRPLPARNARRSTRASR